MSQTEDILAIYRQLGQFARILDEKRWDDAGQVFSEDLTFDYGGGTGEKTGLAAMVENFRRFLDVCGPTQHLIGSIFVEVDGDSARSRSYVQARHVAKGGEPVSFDQIFDTNGEYHDTWRREGGTWKIVRREATWAMHVGNPAVIFS